MSSNTDLIKSKLSIADVVGVYVKLERAGTNLKGLCPFHNEKTPSFFISPDRGTYYCFGCHAKGDIFSFVEQFEGLDFKGALKVLAEKAGVDIEYEPKERKDEKERLYSVLDHAAFFFMKELSKDEGALSYLKGRGVVPETIRSWKLGYAPLEWRMLKEYLTAKGFTVSEMESAGLIKRGDAKDHYDTFRGRIMFPIFDNSGRVIAFSGRILHPTDTAPKYLNSPETALFNKSRTLYGLHSAKTAIRKKDYTILVEGQMDLVMSHQAGFDNTVATSGTALTEEHLQTLKRLSENLMLAFDPDGAGVKAALRSAELALSLGFDVKVASLPKGMDPALLIKEDIGSWKAALKESVHVVGFYTDSLLRGGYSGRKLGREVGQRILPLVSKIPSNVERAHFIKEISGKTGIKEDALWADLKAIGVLGGVSEASLDSRPDKSLDRGEDALLFRLIGIVLWQESAGEKSIDPKELRDKIAILVGGDKLKSAEEALLPEREALVFEAENYHNSGAPVLSHTSELLKHLEIDIVSRDLDGAMDALKEAERRKDKDETTKLIKKCQSLSQRLSALREGT